MDQKDTTTDTQTTDAADTQEGVTVESLQAEIARIKAKKDLEAKHRKTAETKLSELEKWRQEQEEAQASREEEAARKKAEGGDTKALEESWKQKLSKTEQKYLADLSKRDEMIAGLTVKADASRVASEVFGDKAELMLHHVQSRLKVELGEDGAKTRVLDESGQPSALELDELIAELKSNPKFAPFVVATKATGSGAQGGKKGGSATSKMIPRSEFYAKSEPERKDLMKQGYKLTD